MRIGYTRADAARASGAAANLYVEVTVAGASLTYARCAVYRLSGSGWEQIALTADQGTAWATIGLKAMPVTLASAVNPGDELYFAVLSTGTTIPTFRQATTSAVINIGALKRRANLTGQTILPATINPATFASQQGCTFMALG